MCAAVGQAVVLHPEGPAREARDKLVAYFAKHLPRWNYGARLYKGPSVGSGMVEGAAKTVIGQRLKAHAARWQVGNVELMGELCCLAYSDTWDAYWLAVCWPVPESVGAPPSGGCGKSFGSAYVERKALPRRPGAMLVSLPDRSRPCPLNLPSPPMPSWINFAATSSDFVRM